MPPQTAVKSGALVEIYSLSLVGNPFLRNATALGVFDRVQSMLWDNDIATILDKHIGKADWCCTNIERWFDRPIKFPEGVGANQFFKSAGRRRPLAAQQPRRRD